MDQNVSIADPTAGGDESNGQALSRLIEYAVLHHDGCFTLLRFADTWRCLLGTMQMTRPIARMPCGDSLSEAVTRAIRQASTRK